MSDQANADSIFSEEERLNDLQAVDISETAFQALLVNLLGQEKLAPFDDRPLTAKIVAEGFLAAMDAPVTESRTVRMVMHHLDTLDAFYFTTEKSRNQEAGESSSSPELTGMKDVVNKYRELGSEHKRSRASTRHSRVTGSVFLFLPRLLTLRRERRVTAMVRQCRPRDDLKVSQTRRSHNKGRWRVCQACKRHVASPAQTKRRRRRGEWVWNDV